MMQSESCTLAAAVCLLFIADCCSTAGTSLPAMLPAATLPASGPQATGPIEPALQRPAANGAAGAHPGGSAPAASERKTALELQEAQAERIKDLLLQLRASQERESTKDARIASLEAQAEWQAGQLRNCTLGSGQSFQDERGSRGRRVLQRVGHNDATVGESDHALSYGGVAGGGELLLQIVRCFPHAAQLC